MVNPQQPELRRSDRGATSDDATKERRAGPNAPGTGAVGGPVPPANTPGHHPEHEQDKPSGRDFVAKTHALAAEADYVAPSPADEVLDLTQIDADHVHTGADPSRPVDRADRLAALAGKPFALVGHALSAVRDRLPGQ